MNLTRAYLRSEHQPRSSRPKNMGILSVTHELLENMLELPPNVFIRSLHENYERNTLDFILESREPVQDVTFETAEGSMIRRIDIDRFADIVSQQ